MYGIGSVDGNIKTNATSSTNSKAKVSSYASYPKEELIADSFVRLSDASCKKNLIGILSSLLSLSDDEPVIELPNNIDPDEVSPQLSEEEFKNTPEGIRRANLTNEELEKEINTVYQEAIKALEIPKEFAPKITIVPEKSTKSGGSYSAEKHEIKINPNAYIAGTFDLEEILYHEMKHCKGNLLRSSLDDKTKEEVIKDVLLTEIGSKKPKNVIFGSSIFWVKTTEKPMMNEEAQEKFKNFTQKYLFDENPEVKEYLELISSTPKYDLIPPTPEEAKEKEEKFIQFREKYPTLETELENILKADSKFELKNDDALKLQLPKSFLAAYALSMQVRYEYFKNQKPLNVPKASASEIPAAIESYKDEMESVNGNANLSTFASLIGCNSDEEFYQYKFCKEEFEARKSAFKIQKAKIENKLNTNLSDEERDFWNNKLLTIKAKENKDVIGFRLHQAFDEYTENPSKELKKEIKLLRKELKKYKNVK